jgi:hypothetical protein
MSTLELEQTIAARRGRYGPLIESGEVAMKLEDYLRSLPGWQNLAYDQRESLAMVMHKVSRIMCGDPDYDDSWVDIAGYAQNVVNRLRAEQNAPKPEEPKPSIDLVGTEFHEALKVHHAVCVAAGTDTSALAKEVGSLLSSEVKLK